MELKIDPDRTPVCDIDTGIFVRAEGKSVDISELTSGSLLVWLRSRDGNNPLAENTVGILLGHGHIVEAN